MASLLFPRAGFLQFAIAPADPAANVRKVNAMLRELEPPPESLLVLPELWATGFDYAHAARLAEETPAVLSEMAVLAERYRIHLAGSLLEKGNEGGEESQALYNTLYVTGPAGQVGAYRKQHLFGLWQEDRFFAAGGRGGPVATEHGQLAGLVCYDLRFPETARRQVFAGSRLLMVSAQWPGSRLDHWRILLQARAVENQVFVVGGNGCGLSGSHELAGHSMVLAPDGRVLAEAGAGEEGRVVELAAADLEQVRSRFCSVGERPPLPGGSREKIVTLAELNERLHNIRRQGSRVAFTNGCFDILHSGHVAYLEEARKTADCLVVGLNSDASVRTLKGDGRPVNREADRARVLAGLGCVDFVVVFGEDTPLNLIRAILPDVLVKGADWPEEKIVGAAEVKAAGGRVVRIAFEHDISTTAIISRVNKQE
ncbi:MAG: D-glycero-beta-D-manno-heptose 1-phosphate adenylyltransferase [Desulfobulbus sp.]|nr:MAG: D-glycero-beta-D-manno-heptose 1-phosphate adenylyltransferase [Desulfobulbus sp.]